MHFQYPQHFPPYSGFESHRDRLIKQLDVDIKLSFVFRYINSSDHQKSSRYDNLKLSAGNVSMLFTCENFPNLQFLLKVVYSTILVSVPFLIFDFWLVQKTTNAGGWVIVKKLII